jgi:hypothetical protein
VGKHPDLPSGTVRTVDRERLAVDLAQAAAPGPGTPPPLIAWQGTNGAVHLYLDRRTAALLAKRIIECLEATR